MFVFLSVVIRCTSGSLCAFLIAVYMSCLHVCIDVVRILVVLATTVNSVLINLFSIMSEHMNLMHMQKMQRYSLSPSASVGTNADLRFTKQTAHSTFTSLLPLLYARPSVMPSIIFPV